MAACKILYSAGTAEIVEKKSRFIANALPVVNEKEAFASIEETKKKYWDARHNCYAFAVGDNNEITKCSDDGEPKGSAGRPILDVIAGSGVKNVLIIVTRYFGGTLLGVGGLVRAYSAAAKEALAAGKVVEKRDGRRVVVDADYSVAGRLERAAAQMEVSVLDARYADRVRMEFAVSDEKLDKFIKKASEATAGQADIDFGEKIFFALTDGGTVLF